MAVGALVEIGGRRWFHIISSALFGGYFYAHTQDWGYTIFYFLITWFLQAMVCRIFVKEANPKY